MYRIRILDAVTRELAGLDKPVGRRIVERIHWLAENLDEVKPEPLTTGDLAGLYKLRVACAAYSTLEAKVGRSSVFGNWSRTRYQKSPKCTDRMAGSLSN